MRCIFLLISITLVFAKESHSQKCYPETLSLIKDRSSSSNGSEFDQPIDSIDPDSLPNILLIVLDDARYNSYSVNGGPEFFHSTSIDRIANEGVNFKNAFATYALCAPSRATIFTGLYPHKNGAYNNQSIYDTTLATVGTILHDHGYYTALVGKFLMPGLSNNPQPGWDLWMAQDAWGKINPEYNYNGDIVTIPGHEMTIVTDTAIRLFSTKAKTQPLLLHLCYLTPHLAYIPRPQDAGIFANEVMPFPPNFFPYQSNYPSFYDKVDSGYVDSTMLLKDLKNYFECLYGVDQEIGRLLDTLEKLNQLDKTVIIFTSDNGYFHGEHQFAGKKLSHEPAIHVPLFVRYPKWFTAGSEINDQLASNIDLAPTILDAAGIPQTFGMDGFSLRELYDGTKKRDMVYVELIKSYVDSIADLRCVRTAQYKYTNYYCSDTTEEFFDLVNDPLENTNLINDGAYQLVIAEYRDKLDSLKTLLNDTVNNSITNCYIENNVTTGSDEITLDPIRLYPNPASEILNISCETLADFDKISLSSVSGQILLQDEINPSNYQDQLLINIANITEGVYFLILQGPTESAISKLIIMR